MYSFALAYYIFGEDIYAEIEAPQRLYPFTGPPSPADAIGYFAESDLPGPDTNFPKGVFRIPELQLTVAQQEQVTALEFEALDVDIGL